MSSSPSTAAQHAFRIPTSLSPLPVPDALPDSPGPLGDLLDVPSLTLLVTTVLPASAALLGLAYDLAARVPYPKPVQRVARTLASPFRNFFTLEDVEAPTPCPLHRAPWKARVLAAGSVLQSIGWLAVLAYAEEVGEWEGSLRAGVAFLAWTVAFTRILVRPPVTPPYLLICFYVTCVVAALYDLALLLLEPRVRFGMVAVYALQVCAVAFLVWLAGTYPLSKFWPGPNVATPSDPSSNEYTMPEDSVDLWSWCTFSFVEPLFKISNARTVNDTDVWTLSPYFTHKNLFRKYLQYTSDHPRHSLLRYLIVSNSLDLILDVALETWSATVGFVPPYALQRILKALADPSPDAKRTAYFFALIAFLANLSFAQVDANQRWFTRRCYERARGQLFCTLHHKALKRRDISGKNTQKGDADEEEEGNADLGKIVNLMQGDAYAVAYRFWQFSGFFLAPVRLTIALIYLYRVLGWSAFTAVAVTIIVYALNTPLAKYDVYLFRHSWKAADRRMNTVNELFQNIRFLKFYGWEFRWSERVREARETELKWRVKANVVDILITFIWNWMPSGTALATFVCYTVFAKQQLTVATAFTAISLFSYLQGPMMALPGQVFAMLHAYISMQRIEKFLAEPEVPDWASSLKRDPHASSSNEAEIGFENATFEWDIEPQDAPARFTLGPLDIRFPPGKLSLVSGPTGAGKSALLVAMLGEMHCTAGRVILNKAGHQVAYCAQNPWLEHATIRDNIIFGAGYGYDEARYKAVVEACALARDFEIFAAGDMTEIGEKGITLSGGQRARVALARALYSPAKVILLDDPLAAVDLHTATHLVKNALSGPLARKRTIILVTHHISLCLPIAAYLVELSSGAMVRSGSTSDLRDRGELEKLVEAEDTGDEDATEASSATATEVDNEADLGKSVIANGKPRLLSQEQASKSAGKLIDDESRAEGRVSLRTYWTYIKAAGLISWILTVALMLLIRCINVGFQFFLARWGEAYEKQEEPVIEQPVFNTEGFLDNLPPPDQDVKPWLMVYFYISAAGAFATWLYISLGYYASLQASRSLFISMLQRLSRAPARFFDITPIGRILNRFTVDINIVDNALQSSGRAALQGTLNFVISFMVIISVVPAFAPFALVIAWLYIRLAPSYVRASRDLRRLESVSLSPAFAGFDELLRGLPHVRAFGMEERYQDRFYTRVDKFQSFDHVYWLIAGWLNWRYDCLGSVVVYMTTLFALWTSVSSGYAAIVIVQAGVFADASRQLVKVLAQVELDFNSVERIIEYLDVPQEAPAVIADKRPPAGWPSSNGELVVQDLVVRYAPHLPAVLKNLSFYAKPSEKIGIVGRTGSGKSTLAMSLLRIIEPSGGHIIIDGIDITTIGLEDLRSRITIISQDVSLFSGTLRSNLDPFNEHTDRECWDVLERCRLTSILKGSLQRSQGSHEITLDMPISQTGSLSAGERQLVAMARAILRRSNVVILDEATSQIDSDLDDQIQRTIREEFAEAIVITIAHRLKTVLDYDRIMVLSAGEILEFDTPEVLLRTPGGSFRDMCRASTDRRVYEAASEAC